MGRNGKGSKRRGETEGVIKYRRYSEIAEVELVGAQGSHSVGQPGGVGYTFYKIFTWFRLFKSTV